MTLIGNGRVRGKRGRHRTGGADRDAAGIGGHVGEVQPVDHVAVGVGHRGGERQWGIEGDVSAGGASRSDAQSNLGRRAGIEVACVAAGLGDAAGDERRSRSLRRCHAVLIDGDHPRTGRGVGDVADHIVAIVAGGTAQQSLLTGAVGGVGNGIQLRGLPLGKTYGRAGAIGGADQLQAGDVRVGIHRHLVTGKSTGSGGHVGDAGLAGRNAGGVRGDRGGVVIPCSAANRAGGRYVGNRAIRGAVGVGADGGRAAGAVLSGWGLQLRRL
jgi:hypothetical protein